jgi:hypothetical protein
MAKQGYEPVRTTNPDGSNLGYASKVARVTADGLVPMAALTDDQDPVYDHANGAAVSITTNATLITPAAGCSFVEIHAPADIWIRTDGANAVVPSNGMANGVPTLVAAGQPKIVPVTATVAVKAISASGSGVLVTAVPLKARA